MSLRAVLLDATGTLIETREPVGETYARVALEHGAPISAWRLGEAFGRVLASAPPLVFPGAGPGEIETLERDWWRQRVRATFLAADSAVRPRDFEGCFETLFEHFAGGDAWRLREGADAALAELRARGLRLGVVSNFDRRLHRILAALGVADRFEVVALPSDCGAAKPSPAIFEHALARLDVAGHEACFVGDDEERDLTGARALGMRAVDARALATLAELPALVREDARAPHRQPPTPAAPDGRSA